MPVARQRRNWGKADTVMALHSHEASPVGLSFLSYFLFFLPALIWNIASGARLPMDYFPHAADYAYRYKRVTRNGH